MASTLYENVEDWHSNEERKDLLSSGEVDALQVKGDVEQYDRGFEGICPKQEPQDEITEIELHGVDGNTKENGHEYSYKNGNDIDEELDEDEVNDDEDAMNGSEGDNNDQDKEENVELLAKTTEEEATSSVPYYGKTLVAPEYMKFLSPEETSLAGEEAEKDSSQSTLLNEFKDQIKENRKEDQSTEETSVQTVENEEEALEEDDLSSSKEELDEIENDVEKSEDVRHSCPVEGVDQSEEDEEIVEEEKEEEEEWDDSSNGSKLTPLEEKGSPQLAQEDDNEDQSESEEPEKDVEDIGIKEEDEKLVNGEDAGILKMEQTLEKGSEISPGLTKVDDENSDSDEEIDIEREESAGRKHSSSLKVHVHSPTPDISEMDPASQSFDAGEDGNGGKDHVTNQQETMQEQYLNEIDEEEQQRNLFSKPVETNEIYQDEDDLGHEAVDGETYQEGDSEENGEGGDENEAESCESDQEAANVVKDETTATSTEAPLKEEYDVHFSLHGQENESDLTGRVKELGKMFDGGGPVFPSPGRNNSEGVDGSPISVRKYKAIFEQDQMSVQGARDPGRREELINPPRGIVKNLLGLFENPQGFEARKG